MSRTRDISNIYSSDDFSGAGNLVSIDSNYTAVEDDVIFVNTASTAIAVTLPASPSSGGKIKVLDVSANSQNNNITILGNTYNINSASAYVIDTPDSSVDLVYINSNKGWIVSNEYISIRKPSVPTGVSAVDVGTGRAYNDGAATVSFIPALDGDLAASYTVVSTPGSYTATGTSSPIVVPGLQSNTSYTFKVFASNAAGNSTESTASSSITATTVPEAPTISTVQYGYEQISVNYTQGGTGGKAVSAYTATRTGAVSASGTSPISFTSLTGGTQYTVSMTATNSNGVSLTSNSITQTPFTASGGTVSTSGSYRIHTFTGTSNFVLTGNTVSCEYLIIAGGGAGGANYGGGGGAGGYLTSSVSVSPGTYGITVGAGASGGGDGTYRIQGSSSSAFGISPVGGGGGGSANQSSPGGNGGSGGGSGANGGSAGLGTAGQGNNGTTTSGSASGASGGGAGAAATDPGNGGSGASSSITGTSVVRAGGGGGSGYWRAAGGGGAGGGGGGGYRGGGPGAGSANTGGGGGGGSETPSAGGGSGIVIVRYLTTLV